MAQRKAQQLPYLDSLKILSADKLYVYLVLNSVIGVLIIGAYGLYTISYVLKLFHFLSHRN